MRRFFHLAAWFITGCIFFSFLSWIITRFGFPVWIVGFGAIGLLIYAAERLDDAVAGQFALELLDYYGLLESVKFMALAGIGAYLCFNWQNLLSALGLR